MNQPTPSHLRRPRQRYVIAFIALGIVMLNANSHHPPYETGTPPYLSIFLIDGCSQRVLFEELESGHLPNLERIRREGAWVKHGIASFPSMTGYGYYPFLTGRNAVDSGVLGLRWFDRSRTEGNARNYVGRTHVNMNRDIQAWPPTLFERFDTQYSTSINCFMNRGVKNHLLTDLSFSLAKFRGHLWVAQKLDEAAPLLADAVTPDWTWVEHRVTQLAIDDLPFRPKIQWITFASADGYHHTFGFDEEYRRLLREIDGAIGSYREASARQGQESDRIYAIVTDHGVTPVSKHFDPTEWLGQQGVRIYREPAAIVHDERLLRPLSFYDEYDGTLCINGNTIAFLYMGRPDAHDGARWSHPLRERELHNYRTLDGTELDLVSGLAAREEIELVITLGERSEGARGPASTPSPSSSIRVIVTTSTGRSEIWKSEGKLGYRVTSGIDPLSQGLVPLSSDPGDRIQSESEWISQTLDSRFPAAIPRLHALFTSPDIGDLLLVAAPGFDLAPDYEPIVGNFLGGHGGLSGDQLRVSYLLAGPGVRPGSFLETARAEDIGATLHHLLSAPLDRPKDGRSTGRILTRLVTEPPRPRP